MDPSQTDELQEAAISVASLALGATIGAVIGVGVGALLLALVRVLLRRRPPVRHLLRRGRRAFVVLAGLLGIRLGIQVAMPAGTAPGWLEVVNHLLTISVIVALMWLAVSLISGIEEAAFESYGGKDVVRGSRARRIQTQAQMLNRVAVAAVLTVGVAAVLLTFPAARTIGTSILASAGIASVVLGLAAQSVLADLFAGLQIAFTDSLRIDDTVFVEGELGNVEEITLTYVVVRVWDERRLILPSSYFTSTPFQNYTKFDPGMTGTVELDVDWSVPIAAARTELARILATCDAWDGRTGDLQVTDATGGYVRLRVSVSAADNGKLWTVRTQVREGLVEWLQRSAPYAILKSHIMDHQAPAAWDPAFEVVAPDDEAAQDMAELVDAVREERRENTFDRDVRAVSDGDGRRPGETARMMARSARRQALKADRRRARSRPGALGRADETAWLATPSADTTRLLPGMPPAEELPEWPDPEPDLTDPAASSYGAIPRHLSESGDAAPRPAKPAGASGEHGTAGDTAALPTVQGHEPAPRRKDADSDPFAPERRSVRTRLAAMGRRARRDGHERTDGPHDPGRDDDD